MMHKKEIEDAYVKEGENVEVDGIWVKAKKLFDKNKNNRGVTNYEPSFKINIDWGMNPVTLNIYTDMIKEIIDENRVRRKKEAAERKKEKSK
jgi:hypothetical protein